MTDERRIIKCESCNGMGFVNDEPCDECGGSGDFSVSMEQRNIAIEMLAESNYIENERSVIALDQAIVAWDYLARKKELDLGIILRTHKRLMLHSNLMPDEKGYIRKVRVKVGEWMAPQPEELRKLMTDWLLGANLVVSKPTYFAKIEDEIKRQHVEFEKIHPFVDGNGRMGRMLLNWQRIRVGLPILIIKEMEVAEYYEWFK